MSPVRNPWPRRLVQALMGNPELVQTYMIPGSLFCIDCVLRGCLDIDLADAGADMALLAVATFLALLFEDAIEDVKHQQAHIAFTVMFVFIFLTVWVLCLKIISIQNPITINFLWFLDFRLILSWLFGVLAFVISGIIANVVTLGPSDGNR